MFMIISMITVMGLIGILQNFSSAKHATALKNATPMIMLNVNQTALRLRGLWWSIMAFATIARLKFCQKRG